MWDWRVPRGTAMKRSPIKRKRSKPRRIQGVRNPQLVAWIRALPCHFCQVNGLGQQYPTEAAHMPRVRSWGDENNVVPACVAHHIYGESRRSQMSGRWTWQRWQKSTRRTSSVSSTWILGARQRRGFSGSPRLSWAGALIGALNGKRKPIEGPESVASASVNAASKPRRGLSSTT